MKTELLKNSNFYHCSGFSFKIAPDYQSCHSKYLKYKSLNLKLRELLRQYDTLFSYI
jgi:hypothetical protein